MEPEEAEEAAEGDEAPQPVEEVEVADEAASGFDPVRLYLRQMSQNGLLSREGEVEIAKRIEAGELAMMRAAFSTPLALRWVLDLGEKVRLGEVAVTDLVRDEPVEDESEVVADDGGQRRRFLALVSRLRRVVAERDAQALQLHRRPHEPG